MNLTRFLTICITSLLISCGKEDEPKFEGWPESSAPVATIPLGLTSALDDPALMGTWKRRCEAADGKSYLQIIEFKPDFLVYSTVWYQDLFCKTETTAFRFISEYRSASKKLYAQVAQAHIKIESEGIRVAAEKSKSCGYGKWRISTWHDVTGQACPKSETGGVWTSWTLPHSQILNQAYEVEDNTLSLKTAKSSIEFSKQ